MSCLDSVYCIEKDAHYILAFVLAFKFNFDSGKKPITEKLRNKRIKRKGRECFDLIYLYISTSISC